MARKLTRKELLKSPDEFLTVTQRVVEWLRAHSREVAYAGMGAALVVLVFGGWALYQGHERREAQKAYDQGFDALQAREGSEAERLKKAARIFQQVIREHSGTPAAHLALAQLAWVRFSENNYDEAIPLYRQFLQEAQEGDYKQLARLALAECLEAKGDLKGAAGYLQTILQHAQGPVREPAMLALARIYREERQPEKAREILEKFIQEFSSSPYLSMVQARL